MTPTQLLNLESAYSRGVLEIREGDTWVKYQSMDSMAKAIKIAKAELSSVRPSGTRLVTTNKGYY
jgi:hypothetical protein